MSTKYLMRISEIITEGWFKTPEEKQLKKEMLDRWHIMYQRYTREMCKLAPKGYTFDIHSQFDSFSELLDKIRNKKEFSFEDKLQRFDRALARYMQETDTVITQWNDEKAAAIARQNNEKSAAIALDKKKNPELYDEGFVGNNSPISGGDSTPKGKRAAQKKIEELVNEGPGFDKLKHGAAALGAVAAISGGLGYMNRQSADQAPKYSQKQQQYDAAHDPVRLAKIKAELQAAHDHALTINPGDSPVAQADKPKASRDEDREKAINSMISYAKVVYANARLGFSRRTQVQELEKSNLGQDKEEFFILMINAAYAANNAGWTEKEYLRNIEYQLRKNLPK